MPLAADSRGQCGAQRKAAADALALKGVDPDGSQRAWDLYVKVRFLRARSARPESSDRRLRNAMPNTLGEMFTIQRFFQPEMLAERGIQEFDTWAAAFGETTTDLELQPSGLYKPVSRFAEFVNSLSSSRCFGTSRMSSCNRSFDRI